MGTGTGEKMTNLQILQALAFEPRKAFEELRQRPRFWFPLLVVALGTGALSCWYMLKVDPEWFMDLQLRNNPFTRDLSEAQIEQQVQATSTTMGVQAVIGLITTALFMGIAYLVGSLYYLVAGKITNVKFSYRQWLSFSSWCGMPSVLSLLAGAFVLFGTETGSQIDQGEVRPLSLNSLFFHRLMGEPDYTLLSSLELPLILSIALAVYGVKLWSGRSWLFSSIFTMLPAVLLFGIWAIF